MDRSEYYDEIRSLADSVVESYLNGEFDDWNYVYDVVHEIVDSHQWVIYTRYNWGVLQCSDNDTAIFDVFGPQEADDWGTLLTRGAYCAMARDVSEALPSDAPERPDDDDEDEDEDEDDDDDAP